MTITLVNVSTLNGKITKGDDSQVPGWSSLEDQKHFSSIVKEFEVIILGRKTYEASLKENKTKSNRLRIVLTREPKKYKNNEIPGLLEFTNESPTTLVKRLQKSGYKKVLLASGGTVSSHFFKARLVDKIILTLEPLLFGLGTSIIAETDEMEVKLKLESLKKLNKRGTLLLKYSVVRRW